MPQSSRISQFQGLGPSLLQVYAGLAAKTELSLAVGQPSMSPPKEVLETVMKTATDPTHSRYTSAGGCPESLKVIARAFRSLGINSTTEENVLLSHGAKLLLDVAFRAICNASDSLVWFSPGYTYGRMAHINHFKSIEIPTEKPTFLPDLTMLDEALTEAKSETVLVVLNNPVNPTGCVWSKEILESIATVISRHSNVFVVSDETYADIVYPPNEFVSFATLKRMDERTVTIRSSSKEMRIPAYRLGYVTGPREIIDIMKVILGDCVGCPNPFSQAVAIELLKDHQHYASEQLPVLQKNREIITKWCQEMGLSFAPIEGAFYAFICFGRNTQDFADHLIKTQSVGIIPGPAFGSGLVQWARISLACSEDTLWHGLSRIRTALSS